MTSKYLTSCPYNFHSSTFSICVLPSHTRFSLAMMVLSVSSNSIPKSSPCNTPPSSLWACSSTLPMIWRSLTKRRDSESCRLGSVDEAAHFAHHRCCPFTQRACRKRRDQCTFSRYYLDRQGSRGDTSWRSQIDSPSSPRSCRYELYPHTQSPLRSVPLLGGEASCWSFN